MFRLVKSSTLLLTPELAQKFRDMQGSPTEREVNSKRLDYLQEKVTAGHAVPFNWATAKLNDDLYRVNGQHSSTMLCNLDGKFPAGTYVHLDEYEVDDLDGLVLLFRQFDARRSARSIEDIAGAYQGINPALKEVPHAIAKLAAEGICWYEKRIQGTPIPKGDEQYDLLNDKPHESFIQWAGITIHPKKTKELMSAPIVAAMYATFEANESEAKSFWRDVARANGGDEETPATILDRWLVDTQSEQDPRKKRKPAEVYQGCLWAWNASRGNRTIKDIRWSLTKGFLTPAA